MGIRKPPNINGTCDRLDVRDSVMIGKSKTNERRVKKGIFDQQKIPPPERLTDLFFFDDEMIAAESGGGETREKNKL